jgi:hypothetical protein
VDVPREEWIGVPVPDSGIPREQVLAARQAIENNEKTSNWGRRFWELTGGVLRCMRGRDVHELHYPSRNRLLPLRPEVPPGAPRLLAEKNLRAEETEALASSRLGGFPVRTFVEITNLYLDGVLHLQPPLSGFVPCLSVMVAKK